MREVSAVPAYLSEWAVGCLSMELLQTLVPWSQIFHFTWEEVHMQGLASHRGKDSCTSKSAGASRILRGRTRWGIGVDAESRTALSQPPGHDPLVQMTFHRGCLRPSENTEITSQFMSVAKLQFYGWESPQHEKLYERVTALGRLRTADLNPFPPRSSYSV